MKIGISSVCKAFEDVTVGTRVKERAPVLDLLRKALASHDVTKDRVPGQHFVMLSWDANHHVLPGVARRSKDPTDYVVRDWRGRCEVFLRRDKAKEEMVDGVACVVYTREAYGHDPDVSPAELAALGDATHVLIAVLAFSGPETPPAPWTFVRNLAGANNEEARLTADEIRAKAKAVADYHAEWVVVADRTDDEIDEDRQPFDRR